MSDLSRKAGWMKAKLLLQELCVFIVIVVSMWAVFFLVVTIIYSLLKGACLA